MLLPRALRVFWKGYALADLAWIRVQYRTFRWSWDVKQQFLDTPGIAALSRMFVLSVALGWIQASPVKLACYEPSISRQAAI